MRKFLSILIALSLVMSLFSGFVAAPKSVSAAVPAPTGVKILTPINTTPAVSFTPGDEFYVNAVVSNPDGVNGIAGATATLAIAGNAALADGETSFTKPIDLPASGVADVWWKVVCTDPGDVTLTVTSGAGHADVLVHQTGAVSQTSDVTVIWVESPCDTYPYNGIVPVGTYFTVKARATLSRDFEGVYAGASSMTIHYSGNLQLLSAATVPVGDLYYSRPEEAMWNFICLGPGPASVWVEFTSANVLPANVSYVSMPCEFTQGTPPVVIIPGDITLTAPEKVCTNCAQNTFTVTAKWNNNTTTTSLVYATLVIDNPLLAAFKTATIVSKPGESVAAGALSSLWTWDIICLAAGPTSLTVQLRHTATGTVFATKSITVQQTDYMVLLGDANQMVWDPVTMVYGTNPATQVYADFPAIPTDFVYWHPDTLKAETEVCDTFTVKTTFENCTCAPFGIPGISHVIAQVNLPPTVDLYGMVTVEEWVRVSDIYGNAYGASELKNSYQIPAQAVIDNGYILPLNTQCACCYFIITWRLKCIGADADYQEVSFDAHLSTNTEVLLDSASFMLLQSGGAHIQTGIDYFQGWSSDSTLVTTPTTVVAAPCALGATTTAANNFTVVIPVVNTGAAVSNFVLSGTLTGNYAYVLGNYHTYPAALGTFSLIGTAWTWTIPTLPANSAVKLVLELTCTGPTDVVTTLTSATGTDALTHVAITGTYPRAIPITDTKDACGNYQVWLRGPKTLVQIPLSFTIVEPADGDTFPVSSDYAVKIIVRNCSTISTEIFHGLTATLSWGEGDLVEFNPNVVPVETATHQLGDLANGMYAETAWQVHCTGIGSVEFTVTLAAATPQFSMDQTVIVGQTASSSVDVNILSPMELSRYATGQQFAISAQVCVPSDAVLPATGLDVHLFSNYGLEIITAPVIATTMQPGDCKTYTWTVRLSMAPPNFELDGDAVSSGPLLPPDLAILGGFQVHVTGDNIAPAQDMEPLVFYKAAYLITTITGLKDADGVPITDEHPVISGSEFYVCGTIANIGWADATSVNIHAGTLYGDVAPAPGSMAYDYFVGTVPAQRGDPTVPANQFCIKLQCEKAGKTSIALTTSGEDEYGIHWDVIEQRLIVTPLNPIPVNHLENHFGSHEPEAITFVQVDIVPSADITDPVITPTPGQDGAIVYDPHFTLTGTVTDNVGVTSFYVGTTRVEFDPVLGGWFAYPVTLAVGANTFTYKAFDAAGNMGTTSITVTYVVPVDPLLKMVQLSYIEGWNLVTVPLDSTTLSGLAGDINFTGEIYGYSQTTGWFVPSGFKAGQAYWLNMKAAGMVNIYGYEVASPQVTTYASGWVLIGSPYSVYGGTVKVIVGQNSPMLLEEAVVSNFVGNIFYFDGGWGVFDATIDTIQPGLGYWVELKVGASIVFLKP